MALACCGLGCWLGACAHYAPHPLSAERSAGALAARTLDAAGLQAFIAAAVAHPPTEWPPAVWDFELLTLAAYYFHPDLEIARSEWSVARAGQITAGQRPNPVLSVAPSLNATRSTPSPWLVTGTLDVPIETAGKRRHRQARALALSEAARFGVASEAWRVRRRVRQALVSFGIARETLALADRQAALEAEILELVEAQLEAGAVSAFEATRQRIAVQNARLALSEGERRAAVERVKLAEAIGVPARALDVEISSAGLDRLPDGADLADARRHALLYRADIRRALAEYASREAALRLQIARQYPDVHFNPGYEFDQGENKYSLGLSIELPVLSQNQGPIAEAEARRLEAAARFEALQVRVLADVERAMAGYRGARGTLLETEALRAALRDQQASARATFEAGGISRVELMGLRRQVGELERAHLAALARVEQALGELEDAVQGSLDLPAVLWQTPARGSDAAEPAIPAEEKV